MTTMKTLAKPDSNLPIEIGQRLNCELNANNALLLVHLHPDVFFYVKDTENRFCYLNRLTWEGLGAASEKEALGKTDFHFHPPTLAMAYMEEDKKVMSGDPVLNRVWLVHNLGLRLPQWVVSSKVALYDNKGNTVGLAGAMYELKSSELRAQYFHELDPALRYIEQHISEDLDMDKIALQVSCSRTQLNRRFQNLLHMTPTEFILAQRIQHARHLLAHHGNLTISQIAVEVGFCDQSHLTRCFRKVTGETPAVFRRMLRQLTGQ
jgi:AraC-like DNA-binding protein